MPTEASATVDAVLDIYQRTCLEVLAPRTQKDYVRHIALLRAQWGPRIAEEIRPREFAEFIHCRPTGKVQRVRQLAVLSAAFSHAVSTFGIMDRNPLRDVKRPRFKPRDRLVQQHEFDAVLALAPLSLRLGMRLALKIGQRQGDILRLKWDQLKTLETAEGPRDVLQIKQSKTGKGLSILIDAELEGILDECWRRRKYSNPYVLGSRNGRAYVPEGYRAQWQRTMGRYVSKGGKRFQFRDLRAMCATRCPNIEYAQKLLGHANSAITSKVYRRGMELVESLPDMNTPRAKTEARWESLHMKPRG
jgi:integrase